jgi:hypothetical protein
MELTIPDTMDIIKAGRKRKYLKTLEKHYIYRIGKDNLHMNNTHIDVYNPIFETLHELHSREQHSPPSPFYYKGRIKTH